MKPLLAQTYEPHRVTFPCYVQPKLDGIRALYQNGSFQSRDGIPFTPGLLDHLSKPLLSIFGTQHYPLDGELYVHGWALGKINGAVTPKRLEPTEDTLKVEYHIFDAVNFTQSFEDRFPKLPRLKWDKKDFQGPLWFVPTVLVNNEEEANEYYAACVEKGYEGIMYRLGDCPYTQPKQTQKGLQFWDIPNPNIKFLSDQDNRTWHLLKRKDWQDDEFDFLSIRETTGEKGNRGFILTVKSKSPTIPTFDIGSGLSQSEVDFYLENPPVGKKIKTKYLCLSADGIPRHGTVLAVL